MADVASIERRMGATARDGRIEVEVPPAEVRHEAARRVVEDALGAPEGTAQPVPVLFESYAGLARLVLPALALGAVFAGAGPVVAILAFVGAWMLKLALADAFALAATPAAYRRTTAGMQPNPEWQAKVEGASERFRELRRKAAGAEVEPAPTG